MNIYYSDDFSFNEYKEIVDNYTRDDPREINFQNRVVLPLIASVFLNESDISVEDISTQYKNKEVVGKHTRAYYAWIHTPDLLIVRNWSYVNINKDKDDFLAVVEIKSPVLDPISKDNQHTLDEINEYMEKSGKIILTDSYEWIFFETGKSSQKFILHDKFGWVMKPVRNPDYIVKEMGFPIERKESNVWDDLLIYLKKFVLDQ